MKELPIIFKGEMIPHVIDGHKTQTRRVITKWHGPGCPSGNGANKHGYNVVAGNKIKRVPWTSEKIEEMVACPYGKPGDLLYVRENFCLVDIYGNGKLRQEEYFDDGKLKNECFIYFQATDQDDSRVQMFKGDIKWRPSIHLPKLMARIWLENKGVRAVKLQSMSYYDWVADFCPSFGEQERALETFRGSANRMKMAKAFWDRINSKRSPWDDNDWVWAITFELKSVDGRDSFTTENLEEK